MSSPTPPTPYWCVGDGGRELAAIKQRPAAVPGHQHCVTRVGSKGRVDKHTSHITSRQSLPLVCCNTKPPSRARHKTQPLEDRPPPPPHGGGPSSCINSSSSSISSSTTANNNSFVPLQHQTFKAIILFLTLFSSLVKPTFSSVNSYQNVMQHNSNNNNNNNNNKNSGQFQISHLCSPRSPFPITRRVEGATLTSTAADTDFNCTITFRTKSAQQHFVIRFEELKLGCDDHLVLFDGDLDYGQPSIKDFSCRDNMASVPIIKTTGTFLTMRFSSDALSKLGDGFRLVVTAVFDISMSDCPPEYAFCRSQLCISRALFCDGVNHCLDNSDELGCNGPDDAIELPYALGFFVILVLVISIGVIVCIVLHCRRDSPYAAYQHQLQRAFGVPLQTSNSIMFANHQQPQYQFFQPANMSPYVTPQHHAALIATLPRGYSTLPLNLVARQQPMAAPAPHQQAQAILAKPGQLPAEINGEYLMMASLQTAAGHHHQPQQQTSSVAAAAAAAAMGLQPASGANAVFHQQANMVSLPNSQSILSSSTGPGRFTQPVQRDRGVASSSSRSVIK